MSLSPRCHSSSHRVTESCPSTPSCISYAVLVDQLNDRPRCLSQEVTPCHVLLHLVLAKACPEGLGTGRVCLNRYILCVSYNIGCPFRLSCQPGPPAEAMLPAQRALARQRRWVRASAVAASLLPTCLPWPPSPGAGAGLVRGRERRYSSFCLAAISKGIKPNRSLPLPIFIFYPHSLPDCREQGRKNKGCPSCRLGAAVSRH